MYWQGSAVVNNPGIFTQPSCTASVEDRSVTVSLYPNPVQDVLLIDSNIELTKAVIYDLNGKILQESTINNNELPVAHFSKGIYFIELSNENGDKVVERFVKG
ncbi:hypothetical protein JCM19297_163 [Nonlabens ulvanivorans]|nr:T9SS type A sorting domain-containing protein [Nonlabens ulvanivorans]GAK90864.1 hypothetical protein JCM19297_163 [Nonlabens ulvanivorans]